MPNASKLISYARNLRCSECSHSYTAHADHQPKIICWTSSTEGSVCQKCANAMMAANVPCPYCGSHKVRPPPPAVEFVTNGSLLDIVRLSTADRIDDADQQAKSKLIQTQEKLRNSTKAISSM